MSIKSKKWYENQIKALDKACNNFKESEMEYLVWKIKVKTTNFINPYRFVPESMLSIFKRKEKFACFRQQLRLFYYHNIYQSHFMFYCDLMDVLKMFSVKKYD